MLLSRCGPAAGGDGLARQVDHGVDAGQVFGPEPLVPRARGDGARRRMAAQPHHLMAAGGEERRQRRSDESVRPGDGDARRAAVPPPPVRRQVGREHGMAEGKGARQAAAHRAPAQQTAHRP